MCKGKRRKFIVGPSRHWFWTRGGWRGIFVLRKWKNVFYRPQWNKTWNNFQLNSNTTAIKTDFTLSGVASGSLKFAKQGKLAQIAFSGVKLTDQLDSGNSIQIFTVAESYRPEATYYVPGLFDGSKDLILAINSNGQITVQNYSGSPVSTASQIYGVLSYATK